MASFVMPDGSMMLEAEFKPISFDTAVSMDDLFLLCFASVVQLRQQLWELQLLLLNSKYLYISFFCLLYIHSPLVADHFSVNSLPPTAAVNGFVRKAFIVFSTVL